MDVRGLIRLHGYLCLAGWLVGPILKKAKKMNDEFHRRISDSQIYVLFNTLFELVLSLESVGLGPSTIREMHLIRKGIVYLLNKLTVRDYIDGGDGIEEPVSRSLKDLSDRELQIYDLLITVLKHITQCHLKKSTPSDAAKELEKLAQRAQRLAGGSGDDFPLCLRTITDDLRKLTDHVAVVGTKASGIPFIAASVSMALSVVYADVAVEFRPNGSTTQRSERSMTAHELRTRDLVAGVKHLLDNIRDYTAEDCVKRLRAFADRLDECPEVAKYRRRSNAQTDNETPKDHEGEKSQKSLWEDISPDMKNAIEEFWNESKILKKNGKRLFIRKFCKKKGIDEKIFKSEKDKVEKRMKRGWTDQ